MLKHSSGMTRNSAAPGWWQVVLVLFAGLVLLGVSTPYLHVHTELQSEEIVETHHHSDCPFCIVALITLPCMLAAVFLFGNGGTPLYFSRMQEIYASFEPASISLARSPPALLT